MAEYKIKYIINCFCGRKMRVSHVFAVKAVTLSDYLDTWVSLRAPPRDMKELRGQRDHIQHPPRPSREQLFEGLDPSNTPLTFQHGSVLLQLDPQRGKKMSLNLSATIQHRFFILTSEKYSTGFEFHLK